MSWDANANGLCLVYDRCDGIDGRWARAQTSTITSSVDCECRMPGLCQGPVFDRKLVHLERDCAELSEEHPMIGYYSYLAEQKICLLFEGCEVMESFPNAISVQKSFDCNVKNKVDTGEKLLLSLFYTKKSSTAFVELVRLLKPNKSCQLPSFHHQNKVKYLGYVENMNAIVACVENIPDCFTFDGETWQSLTTQRKPSCFDDSFQAIPQGLVNVKGKSKPETGRDEMEMEALGLGSGQGASGRCEADEIVSEIYTGQEWVELEVEDVKFTSLPLRYIRISWYRYAPQLVFSAVDTTNTVFWWSLDYENRKWVSIPEPVRPAIVDDYYDDYKFPDDVLYKGEGKGYLGFYRHERQVYKTWDLNDYWRPISGVFRPMHGDDHDHSNRFVTYDLVPMSFWKC